MDKPLTTEELEAAKQYYLQPWKGETSQQHLLRALYRMKLTPHMWTAGNILFMLSFHFRYREGDSEQIWIRDNHGKLKPQSRQWFIEQCIPLNHLTFSNLPITKIWFMFAYSFFENKRHLLPPLKLVRSSKKKQ